MLPCGEAPGSMVPPILLAIDHQNCSQTTSELETMNVSTAHSKDFTTSALLAS